MIHVWDCPAAIVGIAALMLVGALIELPGEASPGGSTDRPSVLLNARELARLRDELDTIPWKKALYEEDEGSRVFIISSGIKPNAERWMGRHVEIPARSGHYHNFFCDDGTRLPFPEDGKPKSEGYQCPACGRVYKGEKYDGAVRWLAHNQLAVAAFNLALVYAIEGDKRYAVKASEILTKYAGAYPGAHTSPTQGGIMYQSLCEAVWSIPLACAYDFIYDSGTLSADDKAKVEEKLLKPVAEGLKNMGIHGNWGSWHLSAAGVIGYAIRDEALIAYAVESFKSQIANQLGDDGLWPESVHTYHFYPLNAFLYLAEAALHNGTDLYNWEARPGKSLKSMFLAPLNYMYPNFALPAINDGWSERYLAFYQYELAYARYGDSEIGWALREGYRRSNADRAGLWALLHGKSLDSDFAEPHLRSINFPVLGIATLRSQGGSMLTFDYGPHLGHGQRDKMGITLFANDRVLVADYGTPGYGSAVLRWYVSTPAHNTVVVDGRSQKPTKERRLTYFDGGKTFEAAQAETEEAYPGVLHQRTVIRVDDYFVVVDQLSAEEEHTYDWFLRCEGELLVALVPGREPAPDYKFVEERQTFTAAGKWSAKWTADDQGLGLFMLDGAPSLVVAGECPAETAARTVPLIITRRTGKDAVFTSVLYPYRGRLRVVCTLVDGLVKVEHRGLTDWIYTGSGGQRSPMRTDGKFALVRTLHGKPILVSMMGGQTLEWQGNVVLSGPQGKESLEREVDQ